MKRKIKLRNKILRLSHVLMVMAIVPLLACADSQPGPGVTATAGAGFEEGVHYVELFQPLSVETPDNKIEVADVFWYGCPHCYKLEPALQKWKKTASGDIQVISIPGIMNPGWRIHAKAFYAAQAMGIMDKVHEPLFQAIHEQGRRLSSEGALLRFFASLGIDADKFKAAMDSMAVATKVQRAEKLGKESGLTGVPALIVAGRYRVLNSGVRSYDEIFQVVDFLVAKERSRRQNTAG